MTDSFWRDPPWRGGKAGYRMGLQPIESSVWLPDRIDTAELARKQSLLDDRTNGVFAELAESRAGQQQILDVVNEALRNRNIASNGAAPLIVASLQVPDDLCLMQRFNDAYRLTAACVCSPSYWRLSEKIGRTLEGIEVRDIADLERDIRRDKPDIVVLTVPGDEAQRVVDRVVRVGVKAILNFAPTQLQAPADVTVKTVNMAMELEGLSFALSNRD